MDKKKLIIIIIAVVLVILAGMLLVFGRKTPPSPQYSINLEVWGLFDDSDVFREIFDNFQKISPNVKNITYKKFIVENYQNELLEALASGQGPDIFIIHNTWLPSYQDKLAPAPSTILSEQKFKKDFMDVADQDFVSESEVYAVPLTIDSLALFYNKDLFNNASIAIPPTNWDDFTKYVQALTKMDDFGGISVSGAALGTSNNINRPTDILSLLMMQQGSNMNKEDLPGFDDDAGKKALTFYTEFSRKGSPLYSWNSQMHNSLDAFSEGNLAMMFNYSWQIEAIKKKSPKLNFTVTPFPQIPNQNKVNYANYWGYGVSKNIPQKTELSSSTQQNTIPVSNKMRIEESWKLLKFMANRADLTDYVYNGKQVLDAKYDAAAVYAEETKKPVARRDLVVMQSSDPILGIFVEQNLSAKSWKQLKPSLVEGVMSEMITDINFGRQTVEEALRSAVNQINQSYK